MVGEDLCFWPAPKKIGLNLSESMFTPTFVLLKFSEVSGPPSPPPFSKSCVRYCKLQYNKDNIKQTSSSKNFIPAWRRRMRIFYTHMRNFYAYAQQPKTYCFEIDIRLLFLVIIPVILAVLTRNKIRMSIPKQYVLGC